MESKLVAKYTFSRSTPKSGDQLGLLAIATVIEDGWVDLTETITVHAGDTFIAVPEVEPGSQLL